MNEKRFYIVDRQSGKTYYATNPAEIVKYEKDPNYVVIDTLVNRALRSTTGLGIYEQVRHVNM